MWVIVRTLLLLALWVPAAGFSQQAPTDAQQLARDVAADELRARQQIFAPWMYTLRKDDAGKKEVLQVVQTNEGPLARTLSRNGQPLNQEQQRRQTRKIQELVRDPGKQQEQARKFQHDIQNGLDLMKILPQAFTFRADGRQGGYLQLDFQPNPNFRPGSVAARVSHAMRGTMLVDPAQKRMSELKGVITNDVKFAGGILGIVRKGGSFQFRQSEAGPGKWVATLIDVNLSGRVLLFHTVNKRQHWTFSDFHPVPANLTLAQAANLLKANSGGAASAQQLQENPTKPAQ